VLSGASADVEIPVFRCISQEVAREKGYLAVEARSNLEVAELRTDGLAMVDVSEIPTTVSDLASASILFGYKFLNPNYHLSLRVKRHSDAGVLIAACDEAYFVTTVSSEGKVLHKIKLTIRNTQKQYVRIKLPVPYDIWSTSVAGTSVKPARDEEGRIMIPLEKSSGESASKEKFDVELVYIETEDREVGNRGNLSLTFASIDLPVNTLCVSVFLPSEYEFGRFIGDLKEVRQFTKNVSTHTAVRAAKKKSYINNANHVISQFQSNATNPMYLGEMDRPMSKVEQHTYTKAVGVLPVIVDMPVDGQEFKFEQMIVMGGNLSVTVDYTKKKNASYGKTRTRKCCIMM
jgi:hypothetical protein